MTDMLIGTIIIVLMLQTFFLLLIYKLKKRINVFEKRNNMLSHDLKTLLATFRLTLDGLKNNEYFNVAMKNEGTVVRGGLPTLIELFDGIGQGMVNSINKNDSITKLECRGEFK